MPTDLDTSSAEISSLLGALDLSGPVTQAQLRRAFRRSALRYHPDRRGDDPAAAAQFRRVAAAYTRLQSLFETAAAGQTWSVCPTCARLDRLLPEANGRKLCSKCLLHGRARLLPAPRFTVVRGIGVGLLELAAAACAAIGAMNRDARFGVAAVALALFAVIALACMLTRVDRFES